MRIKFNALACLVMKIPTHLDIGGLTLCKYYDMLKEQFKFHFLTRVGLLTFCSR